jgi:hypothetical protein
MRGDQSALCLGSWIIESHLAGPLNAERAMKFLGVSVDPVILCALCV